MTDIRKAVIEGGKVINVIVASDDFELEGFTLVASETAQKGDLYENGEFTAPPPVPVSRAQVDAERDRRVATTFQFAGKLFQLDDRSISRITAMGAAARFAIAEGAEAGDLFWDDPTTPFGFIATDNTIVPMDAFTMRDFSNAAKFWVSRHTFKGLLLKGQDPIPQDFASNDSYWPAAE